MCDVLSALLSTLLSTLLSALLLRCFLRCFCVYSLADSGESRNPIGPGTSVVRTRYLNCHGRARPNTE